MRNIFLTKKGSLVLLFILIFVAIYPKAFGWHRPYVNWLPWDLAEYLVEKDRLASECFDLIWFQILSPTQAEQRALCVYEYAKLKQDPSACELLMPSSYGWSCLGAAEELNQRWCWFDFGKKPALVGRGEISVTIPECESDSQSMLDNRCCELALTLYVDRGMNCDAFAQEPQQLHDQCLALLANREKDIHFCSSIASKNFKTACEV